MKKFVLKGSGSIMKKIFGINKSKLILKKYHKAVIAGDIDKMRKLRNSILPTKIYRYRAFDSFWYDIIIKGNVFMGTPKNFNDPFDCVLRGFEKALIHTISKGKISSDFDEDKYVFQFPNGEKKSFSKILNEAQNNIKDLFHIACFSERGDSLPMWAHYADNHRGYVIEYDLSKIDIYDISPLLYKVIYLNAKAEKGIKPDISLNRPLCATLIKGIDWEYEKEWRMIDKYDSPKLVDLSHCITAIYLGACFDKQKNRDELQMIKNHLDNIGIELKEMHLNSFGCSLVSKKAIL